MGHEESPERTTRRTYLRRGVELGTTGSIVLTAGCLDSLQPSSVGVSGTSIREQDGSDLSADELETFVGEMRDRYDDSGPWGSAAADPGDELAYRGAWTTNAYITEDGDPYNGNPDNLLAASDHLAVLYEIPDKVDENGKQHFVILLWSGARIPEEKRGGGPIEGTPVISRVRTGIELDVFTEELLSYYPSKRRSGDTAPVIFPASVSYDSSYPLNGGKVEPVAGDTRVGEEGKFTIEWSGKYDDRQAVVGVCETRWDTEEEYSFTWDVELEGGRSRLL